MSPSPTRGQLAFVLGSVALAPLVALYATQVVWLQSLWDPLPWMAPTARPWGCSGGCFPA